MSTKTNTKEKKAKSIFGVIFVILMLILIALTVTSNVIFSGESVPMVAGRYLYLNESDEMEPAIPQNSLVFAKQAPALANSAATESISQGNKVLCYLADGSLVPRMIYDMASDSNGETVYYPGTPSTQADTLSIPRSSIIAVCTWASKELYTFVMFSTSVPGLMAFLVVPCIILIVLLLVKIAKSSKEDISDEDFFFDEEEIKAVTRKPEKVKNAPLFNPEKSSGSDEALEKKKSSISENFSAKPVNENSPYQKAVQERTMKFRKIQQEDLERAKQEERAKTRRAIPDGTQVFSPSEVENNAKQETVKKSVPIKTERAPMKPAVQESVPQKSVKPVQQPEKKASERKFSSPNIDDILNATDYRSSGSKSSAKSSSNIASTGSIDDLIAALEKEKNKL